MSMSQHDLAAKSCPAHNFVILSQILKLFHRKYHYIETMCRAQHLGRYFAHCLVLCVVYCISLSSGIDAGLLMSDSLVLYHSQNSPQKFYNLAFFVTKYPFGEHHPSSTVPCL